MADELTVTVRSERGKHRIRRLRQAGRTPAVLYGHRQPNVSLSVPGLRLAATLRQGAKLVQLTGEVEEIALIRDVQWDTFAMEVLHVDFLRVSAGETVETSIRLQLRGVAPGASEGGVVEQLLHEVAIECPVMKIPEKLEVNVNSLKLRESLSASDLALPPGAELLTDPETVVVQCAERADEGEAEGPLASTEGVEPEVIGRKPEEDQDQQ